MNTPASRLARAAFAAAASLLLLTGCVSTATPSPDFSSVIDSTVPQTIAEIDGLSAVELVNTMEAVPVASRPASLMVSVRPDALTVTDATNETSIPMPDDAFYLSVAPYRTHTHDCFFHSLTTCRGEYGNASFRVTLTTDTGDVLLDEDVVSADNGFIGLWLPRNIAGVLEIADAEGSASVAVGTGPDDPTCLTTVQLS